MRESWRWFGPNDPVSLEEIRQTGATDIVSALHDIAIGEAWPRGRIAEHKTLIEAGNVPGSQLHWTVVESIPVHDDIKLRAEGHEAYVDAWIESMRNLAAEGIKTICYNFMPVIDWTRTDLRYQLPNGAFALRFDQDRFAAFDLFILCRDKAERDYSEAEIARARSVFASMGEGEEAEKAKEAVAEQPAELNGFAFGWSVFVGWLKSLFGSQKTS